MRLESTGEIAIATSVDSGWLLDLGVIPIGSQIRVNGQNMQSVVLRENTWPFKEYVREFVDSQETVVIEQR